MNNFRRKILMIAYKLSDLLIMIGSFMAVTIIVSHDMETISLQQFLNMPIKIVNFVLFVVFLLLWHSIFTFFDLYSSRRLASVKTEIEDILFATSMGTFFIYALLLLFSIKIITTGFIAMFWLVSICITVLARLIMRYFLKWARCRGRNLRYILIVGTNSRAVEFARKIESEPELGYVVSGFVDEEWEGNGKLEKFGWKLVSDFKGFIGFIRNNVVDEVLVSLPVKSYYQEIANMMNVCENQGIVVRQISNIFNTRFSKLKLENIENEPVVSHYRGSMEGWQVLVKEALDRIISMILLLLLMPLFIIVVVLIKITSPGPVFFIQERVGLNKRHFRLYKFRTMVNDAEQKQAGLEELNEVEGAAFKIKNDPRITFIGRFLRETSIDELPQLINVLKGDMSLVGPRPLPVRDYNNFKKRFSSL